MKRISLSKKLLKVTLLLIAFGQFESIQAQFFKEKFDALDFQLDNGPGAYGSGNGYTVHPHVNANALQTDGSGPIMRSYIRMYKVTSNTRYLKKLIVHSKNIQDRRDDQLGLVPFTPFVVSRNNVNLNVTLRQPNSPTWSQAKVDNAEWYSSVLNAGGITRPMAEFIHLVKVLEPSLQTEPLPTLPFTHPSNQLTMTTYGEYVDWLITKIFETINYYDNPINHDDNIYEITEWRKPVFMNSLGEVHAENRDLDFFAGGLFHHRVIEGGWLMGNVLNDWNQQHVLAITMVYLRETLEATLPGDPRINYLDTKLGILARNFKENLELVGNHYEWTFRTTYTCPTGISDCDEDISHASFTSKFPLFSYQYGLNFSNGAPLFNEVDIERLTRSITESAYYKPLRFFNSINGTDFFYQPTCTTGTSCYYTRVNYLRTALGRWLQFTEVESNFHGLDYTSGDLYQMAAEVFLDEYIIRDANFDLKAEFLIGIANLAYYQKVFNPVGLNRIHGESTQWAGVSGGDFDNDGVDEFITASNFAGNFYMYEYQKDHLYDLTVEPKNANTRAYEYQIKRIASETDPGAASDWVDVVAGDFDRTHPGDEFIAARNFDGKFHLYELNGNSIDHSMSYQVGQGKSWIGLAAGDFDNDNRIEFAALEKGANRLYILEVNGSGFIVPDIEVYNNGFYIGAGDWSGLASGDFDGDDYTELVSANNTNGNIVVFKINANLLEVEMINASAGASSNWTDLTGGDFNGDGVDEFIAHRKVDGTAWVYKVEAGAIVSIGKEQFTGGQQVDVWGSGNFVPSLTNTRDEVIALRNLDGAQLMYSLEGLCENGYPCPKDLNGLIGDPGGNNGSGQLITQVALYPNPSIDHTNLTFEIAKRDQVTVELQDLNGIVLKTVFNKVVPEKQVQTISINKGNFRTGAYMVVIKTDGGIQTSKQLIFN